MTPQARPEWTTSITLGSISDQPITYYRRINQMILREIPDIENNTIHQLKWPLKVTVETNEDLVIASNEDLDLLAYGSSEAECLNNFYSIFDDMKRHYTEISEDKITGHAIRLKALFASITD